MKKIIFLILFILFIKESPAQMILKPLKETVILQSQSFPCNGRLDSNFFLLQVPKTIKPSYDTARIFQYTMDLPWQKHTGCYLYSSSIDTFRDNKNKVDTVILLFYRYKGDN